MLLYPLIGIIAWSQNVLYEKLQIIKFYKNFKIIPSAERNTDVPFFFSVIWRSSRPEVFLRKSVLKICSKFTGEHPWRSVISITLLCNFIEITLWHGCSPVNLMHIFRTTFPKNTSEWLLLELLSLWALFCANFRTLQKSTNIARHKASFSSWYLNIVDDLSGLYFNDFTFSF